MVVLREDLGGLTLMEGGKPFRFLEKGNSIIKMAFKKQCCVNLSHGAFMIYAFHCM